MTAHTNERKALPIRERSESPRIRGTRVLDMAETVSTAHNGSGLYQQPTWATSHPKRHTKWATSTALSFLPFSPSFLPLVLTSFPSFQY